MVLVSGGIDDLCLKYFVEAGAMGVRRCKKADLKRIARATGGKLTLCETTCGFSQSYEGLPKGVLVPLLTSKTCLLYTSPSPRDQRGSRMPSSA